MRHSRANPCPICRGGHDDKQGQGVRCAGFTSEDREYARCSREDHAGNAPLDPKCQPPCYVHKLKGECKCGRSHGPEDIIPYPSHKASSKPRPPKGRGAISEVYTYTDGTGLDELYQAVKYMGKGFSQRRPDPDRPGQWIHNLDGVQTVLYRLPDLIAAGLDEVIWIVEGEKDVETLRKLGLVATTNPMGAGKWQDRFSPTFRGRKVAIVGDNDKPGRDHCMAVAKSVQPFAESIRCIELAAHTKALGLGVLPEKGDVSDFFAMGGTVAQLLELYRIAPDPFRLEYATLADAVAILGDTRWVWEGWIAQGNMSLLAAIGGGGKTRTAADLARRLWYGYSMPDGSPNPFPPGTKTLWIMYDRNWQETAQVAKNFGLPLESILLPCIKTQPLQNPDFDDPRTIEALALQIEQQKPGLIIIDTMTYATSRNTSKAEEAKAAFDGILQLSATTGVAVLALTHLNKEGEVLGRRISERARSVIMLSLPDPEGQPNRRKLWVEKTAVKKPEPLGITFTDTSNEYDDNPPEQAEAPFSGKRRGPAPTKSLKDAEWLWEQLSEGARRVKDLIDTATRDNVLKATKDNPKPSPSPLYRAKDRIPALKPGWVVDELEIDNRKFWRLVGPDATEATPGNEDGWMDTLPDVRESRATDVFPAPRPTPADFHPTHCDRCSGPLDPANYRVCWNGDEPQAECLACTEFLSR